MVSRHNMCASYQTLAYSMLTAPARLGCATSLMLPICQSQSPHMQVHKAICGCVLALTKLRSRQASDIQLPRMRLSPRNSNLLPFIRLLKFCRSMTRSEQSSGLKIWLNWALINSWEIVVMVSVSSATPTQVVRHSIWPEDQAVLGPDEGMHNCGNTSACGCSQMISMHLGQASWL